MLRARFVIIFGTFKSFGMFKWIENSIYSWNTKQLEHLIARTLKFWALLSNQNNRITRSIYPIKDTMEQLHFIITKITKNCSQQYDCAMNNTRKMPYFLAYQKIPRTYINKSKRKNTQNGQIIYRKVCFTWTTYSFDTSQICISKSLSVNRDVNFSSRKSVGRTFLTFGTRYDESGRKRVINYWVNFC